MRKIGLITSGYFPVPAVMGGAMEKHFEDFACQNELYNRCTFIIISRWNEKLKEVNKKFDKSKFYYINKDKTLHKIIFFICRCLNKVTRTLCNYEPFSYSNYYKKALEIVQREKCDNIVFGGGYFGSCFSMFLKYFKPEQLFLYINGNWFPTKTCSKTFGNLISVSEYVEKEYISVCTNKKLRHKVLRTGINEQIFGQKITSKTRQDIRNNLGFSLDDFVVIFCGRVCKEKGVSELINAILFNNNKRIKLMIIGSHNYGTNETSDYVKIIEQKVLENPERIIFTGYVKNSELYRYYQSGDCLCVPSLWDEPSGTVVLEGLWSGIPLVVTRSGGIPEYVTKDCAFIFDRNEALSRNMGEAFVNLAKDNNLYKKMSNASKEFAKKFTLENYYNDFMDIVEK